MSAPDLTETATFFRTTLQTYLDSSTTVDQTATAITTKITDPSPASTAEDRLFTLWTELFTIIKSLPPPDLTHSPPTSSSLHPFTLLINLLTTLRNQSSPLSTLSGFGPAARSAWNASPSTTGPSVWTNLNTFIALLWSQSQSQSNPESNSSPVPFDFSLYAIWSLRSALETPQSPTELAWSITGAAAWVLIPTARDGVWAESKAGVKRWEASPKGGAPAKGGPLWESETLEGFTRERWEFWKRRFGEVAEEVGGEVGEVARRAREGMEGVEA